MLRLRPTLSSASVVSALRLVLRRRWLAPAALLRARCFFSCIWPASRSDWVVSVSFASVSLADSSEVSVCAAILVALRTGLFPAASALVLVLDAG